MGTNTLNLGYADIELSLDRSEPGCFRVRLHSWDLGLDRTPPPVFLMLNELAALRDDPDAYGRRLGEQLFTAPGLADGFGQAKGTVFSQPGHGLRLRLVIPPDVSELHRLAWETLLLPGDPVPLVMDERILFSRHLGGQEIVVSRPHTATPRILAAVADPTDLPVRGMAHIDVAGELERLRSVLGDWAFVALPDGAATISAIVSALRAGCDVLYLGCHGVFDGGTPLLVLEDDDRKTVFESGREIANAVRHLPYKPGLVVLGSCQSAGAGEGEVLATVGPLLVDAGVSTVVAMQGNVFEKSLQQWLTVFWREWRQDRQVDRAVAVARWAIRSRPDWWIPVVWQRSPGTLTNWRHDTEGAAATTPHLLNLDTSRSPIAQDLRERQVVPSRFVQGDIDWVFVPGGKFRAGTNHEYLDKYVSKFWVARTPITNAQYLAFVQDAGHPPPRHWSNGLPSEDKLHHPVVNVSWFDALAFCKWSGGQLPNEAQWEKAARGADFRIYPWGNEEPDDYVCNFASHYGDTTDVRTKLRGSSPYGCMDMAGNVWEWTDSFWIERAYSTPSRRTTQNSDTRIVLKGGSFFDFPKFLRCEARIDQYPLDSSNVIGFRVLTTGAPK